jgi:acetyl/propionyl-CoA carboxylase alpha subunit
VANRGEIAQRIIQACRKLGLDFVCVYTKEDEASGHLALARQLGGQAFRISSYHDANEIMAVADHALATAVHPGYGYFAEDYRFARRVSERTRPMVWIGPSWRVIRTLGDKINTKRLARSLSVPTVPGSDRPVYDELEAEEIADSLFRFQAEQGIDNARVLVKASAGGGGMGIEEVHNLDHFKTVYRRIRNYAKRQFHDEGVLIEQRILTFNHLEVQIAADRHGSIAHFGTRNCTIQSTGRQKRVEIAPGFAPDHIRYTFDAAKVISDITGHSLAIAKEVGYDNVGTWEWIVAPTGQPFLMEVNTRIQVENGVSAAISRIKGQGGVDIIKEQIRMGLGEPMGFTQNDVTFEGVAIEYRIIAEDPANRFTPWVGRIDRFLPPKADWAELHSHVPTDKPYVIPTEFDPNLALAIIWGKDLAEAKTRGVDYLDRLRLEGQDQDGNPMKSNIAFLREKTADILVF